MCKRIRLVSVRSFLVAATSLAIVSGAAAQEQSSLELARQALAQNDRQMASLYFANAMSKAPQAIPALKEYTAMVEKELDDEIDEDVIFSAYNQLRQLVQNAASYVEPGQISDLNNLLNDLQQRENARSAKLSNSGSQVNDEERKTLLKELETSLKEAESISDNDSLEKNYANLEEKIADAAIYTQAPEFSTILDNAQKKLTALQTDRQFSQLLQQTQTLIKRMPPDESPETIKALSGAAEGVISNLLLAKNDVSPWLQSELNSTIKSFSDVCQRIIEKNDQKILDSFIERERTLAEKKISFTKKINLLTQLIQDVQASSLSHDTMLNKLGKYNASLSAAIEERSAFYNQWALGHIRSAFVRFQKNKDAENAIPVFAEELTSIDVRHLNYAIQQCYSEVYNFGTMELKGAERVQVAQIMASTTKKKIEDF
ncbi:hypothetical protein [Pyramidobacter porci]